MCEELIVELEAVEMIRRLSRAESSDGRSGEFVKIFYEK